MTYRNEEYMFLFLKRQRKKKREINHILLNFVDSFTVRCTERNLISQKTNHYIQTHIFEAVVIIRIYRHLYFKVTRKIVIIELKYLIFYSVTK